MKAHPHPHHTKPVGVRVVTSGREVIADSRAAVALKEATTGRVLLPARDVKMERLERTETELLPFKGRQRISR